jgi:hypothetical protein
VREVFDKQYCRSKCLPFPFFFKKKKKERAQNGSGTLPLKYQTYINKAKYRSQENFHNHQNGNKSLCTFDDNSTNRREIQEKESSLHESR